MNPINKVAMEVMTSIMVSFSAESGVDHLKMSEVQCLSENIYFEARAESIMGKVAVANVTKNRLESDQFPDTYCDVVTQGPKRESWKTRGKDVPDSERVYWPIKHRCQFSWYCDGEKDTIWVQYMNGTPIEANATAWRDSVNVALFVMTGLIDDNTKGSIYYYNHHLVYPHWADEFERVGIIGNHTFMKE